MDFVDCLFVFYTDEVVVDDDLKSPTIVVEMTFPLKTFLM
jgi:hypothetical protein